MTDGNDEVVSVQIFDEHVVLSLANGISVRSEPRHFIDRVHLIGSSFSEKNELMRHWRKRNWTSALPYHLASIAAGYLDKSDPEGQIRDDNIRQYLESEDLPKRMGVRGEVLDLPRPVESNPLSFEALAHLLLRRRTWRKFRGHPTSAQILSNFLWHALDKVRRFREVSSKRGMNLLRSYGVAFDFFIAIHRCAEVPSGIYSLDLDAHHLIQIRAGEFGLRIQNLLQNQGTVASSAFSLFLVADFEQYSWRYRHERALRNLYLEAGRIAQEILVVGERFGFRSFVTPACSDLALSRLLQLDLQRQYPMYSISSGPADE